MGGPFIIHAQQTESAKTHSDYLHGSSFIMGIGYGNYLMNNPPEANKWLAAQHEPQERADQPLYNVYISGFINRFGGSIGFETNKPGSAAGFEMNNFKVEALYKLSAGKQVEVYAGLGLDIYEADINFKNQPAGLLYFQYPDDAFLRQINAGVSPRITIMHPLSRTHRVLKYFFVAGEIGYRQMASYGVWRYGYNTTDRDNNSNYNSFPLGSFIGNGMASGVFFNFQLGCNIETTSYVNAIHVDMQQEGD